MPTRQILNNGEIANDGTGDTLREAATKINSNFEELWGGVYEGTGFANADRVGHIMQHPTLAFGVAFFQVSSVVQEFIDSLDPTWNNHVIDLAGHSIVTDTTITLTGLSNVTIKNAYILRSTNTPNNPAQTGTIFPVFELVDCSGIRFVDIYTIDTRGVQDHFTGTVPTTVNNFESVATVMARLENCHDIHFSSCTFEALRYGILGKGTKRMEGIKVTDCRFNSVDRDGVVGDDGRIPDATMGASIYGNGLMDGVIFSNNRVSNSMSSAHTGDQGDGWVVSSNTISDTIDSSIYLRGKNHTVTNNVIMRSGKDGIKIRPRKVGGVDTQTIETDEGYSTITGNVVRFAGYFQPDGGTLVHAYGPNNIISANTLELDSAAAMKASSTAGIRIRGRNTTVQANSIVGPWANPMDASVDAGEYIGIGFSNNFSSGGTEFGGDDCLVIGNNMTNITKGIEGSGMDSDFTMHRTMLTNNSISTCDYGIYINPGSTKRLGDNSSFRIIGNIFDSCEVSAIRSRGAGPVHLENNSFNNNQNKTVSVLGLNDAIYARNNVHDGTGNTPYVKIEGDTQISLQTAIGNSWDPIVSSVLGVKTIDETSLSSGNYFADAITDTVLLCDATVGGINISLPNPTNINGANQGNSKNYLIKKIDATANAVTIDPNNAQTIDGAQTVVITTQYESIDIVSDGANWFVV